MSAAKVFILDVTAHADEEEHVIQGFATDEEILRCNHCDNPFHNNHLQEYVKIKGECPVCKEELKIDQI